MDIAVTGASGFIGRETVKFLREVGRTVFTFDKTDRLDLLEMLENPKDGFDPYAIIHLGACADTTSQDKQLFDDLNLEYSKSLWSLCAKRRKKLIYASSAATYGDGSQGFDDKTETLQSLKPLNLYAQSKHDFDLWAIQQAQVVTKPPHFAGLKFFNVYGPDEASKGNMASMVYRIFQQAKEGKVRLFKDGEQKRDWVSVYDVVNVIDHMIDYRCFSIYNVGSGQARSFNEIADLAFKKLGKEKIIEYFDMPESLKPAYQSFSEAKLDKLRRTDYAYPMITLESGMDWMV